MLTNNGIMLQLVNYAYVNVPLEMVLHGKKLTHDQWFCRRYCSSDEWFSNKQH